MKINVNAEMVRAPSSDAHRRCVRLEGAEVFGSAKREWEDLRLVVI